MRFRFHALLPALPIAALAAAQVSHGGQPAAWSFPRLGEQLPRVELAPLAGDEAPPEGGGFRYGVQRFVQADVIRDGASMLLEDGSTVRRIALRSPGAVMLSVQFDRWELNDGEFVYLYTPDLRRYIGGFDASNRQPDGTMATAVLPGDEVVIEHRAFKTAERRSQLRVSSITHGIVDLFGFQAEAAEGQRDIDPGFQSSPCQINVICPEAAAWQDQKRSVALFLRPDGGGCTGNLVNNTQVPRKPYFEMAQHCFVSNTSGWVFYWNYESPGCVGTVGPSDQTTTGCVLRAGDYYRDLLLVELNSEPPAAYHPYYAGWDRSGATPQSGVVIQHPMYDVKKIAFDHDPLTSVTDAIGVQCWRTFWDQGLGQAVASGAPLFDQNKRMVGHYYDGGQVCSTATSVPSLFAKLGPMWDGPSPSARLRDWLNPANNLTFMDGAYAAAPSVQVRVKAFLEGPFNTGTNLMDATLRANGLVPLAEPYSALGYPHASGGGAETTNNAVLAVTGANAIVDWVVVELRSALNPAVVVATRSALLQADGDIVSAADGASPVLLSQPAGGYHIAIRHRNHLGIMTASPVALSSTPVNLDLSNGSVPLFGGAEATKPLAGRNVLWAGDADGSQMLRYVGASNDRDPILVRIGGSVPTATASGYHPEDINLDGVVRYVGGGNDRDPILVNIGGSVPTNTRAAQLP